jgi:hypothetical protein
MASALVTLTANRPPTQHANAFQGTPHYRGRSTETISETSKVGQMHSTPPRDGRHMQRSNHSCTLTPLSKITTSYTRSPSLM